MVAETTSDGTSADEQKKDTTNTVFVVQLQTPQIGDRRLYEVFSLRETAEEYVEGHLHESSLVIEEHDLL